MTLHALARWRFRFAYRSCESIPGFPGFLFRLWVNDSLFRQNGMEEGVMLIFGRRYMQTTMGC